MESVLSEEEKFREHLPLVEAVIGQLAMKLRIQERGAVGLDDLLNVGRLGLLEAVRRWRPDGGSTFHSYARMKIRGAALDEVRRMDFAPRSFRDKQRVARAAGEETEVMALLSLDRSMSEDESSATFLETMAAEGAGPDREVLNLELGRLLFEWMKEFPEDYRTVAEGIYQRELRMREVADELGVTESRVCQMHAHIIEWYRKRLQWLGEEI